MYRVNKPNAFVDFVWHFDNLNQTKLFNIVEIRKNVITQ